MPHLIKVHGGAMYSNWANAAMALHRLNGFEDRLQNAIKSANEIFSSLNKLPGIKISPLTGGTNIYSLQLEKNINGRKLQQALNKEFNIRIPGPNDKNQAMITVNETLIYQPADYIITAFKKALE